MPMFYSPDGLHPEVEPLSQAERTWLTQLEHLLLKCPSQRLHLATIGDPGMTAFDNSVTKLYGIQIEDGGAATHGVALAEIKSKPQIHGVSG